VNYWADMQSVHAFHCYDNKAPNANAKCQQVLVIAVCLVLVLFMELE